MFEKQKERKKTLKQECGKCQVEVQFKEKRELACSSPRGEHNDGYKSRANVVQPSERNGPTK